MVSTPASHGQTIQSAWTSNKPQTFKSSPEQIVETLTGSRCRTRPPRREDDCHRPSDAKGRAAQFLVHLGMTGRLLVSEPEVPVPPHTHAVAGA